MTVNWEWIEKMVSRQSTGMPDAEEYQAFALWWIYEKLTKFMAEKKNPPNLNLIVLWSAGYYRRMKKAKDADENIGYRTHFISPRIDPSEQVAIKLDTESFFERLNANQKRVLQMTLEGYGTNDIAGDMRKSPGRISQIRAEIEGKALEHLAAYI